ncbi:hypothetical protein ACEWQ7_004086 [Salmonella enterica]|uniref:Uncharacterized protein n=1 Tax=Salmonella enterica TaxID=28901 RepID=A0A5U4D3A8_SALER|nr:hypothetical protein [Salmonella enterica subsp. enterica]EBP8539435.1 hypothetical protein [Salmonella enterica]EBT4151649.1 hypothetical protein [Salmonella enterica subsp. enterica]EED9463776.1 hypothetical protein [Salmonella enterica subsp. enterica serovar Abaetetuba]EEN6707965.1 hypothetical protein [Salmonella enterica subsp. enterica serovar Rubislaw]
MHIKNKSDLTPGIAANRIQATPEQRLIIYADLEAVLLKAEANTRHNQKAQAMEYAWNWLRVNKKNALNEIENRGEGL